MSKEVVEDWNKKTRKDLIIKVKPGINIKADAMEHWRKEILRMMETGVIVIPWFLDVVVVPEDVEVSFIDPKNSVILEDL